MIIKFPTGFYDLPDDPSDSASVTYTVSNEEPPRTDLIYPKIPPGVRNRQREPLDLPLVEKRDTVGELVFTVSRASRFDEGNNAKQFETGQILEFGDAIVKTLEPMLVSEKTETQHNLNQFDYDTLGLTDEERQLIDDSSLNTHDQLMDRLNDLKRLRADSEVIVNTQQKIINEATSNINALEVIADSSEETSNEVQELIDKLVARRQEAINTRDQAADDANQYASEANDVIAELRTVATVLK